MTKELVVNIINPMENPNGGSEMRALEISRQLSPFCRVAVWSEYEVSPLLSGSETIEKINARKLHFPFSGVFIFVGTYFWVGNWLRFSHPSRIIVIHNVPWAGHLENFITRLVSIQSKCSYSVAYASEKLKKESKLDGTVMLSPIDVDRFKSRRSGVVSDKSFVVGRLSRDDVYKHHPDDCELYKSLARKNVKLRLMGATCIKEMFSTESNIEVLPSGAEDAADFLHSLNVFFYRTSPEWFEPHGRVVTEAMAAGVPVVVGKLGGYTEFIKDGETGIVIENNDEAERYILLLKDDPVFRERIAENAKRFIRSAMKEEISKLVDFVLDDCSKNELASIIEAYKS